jgi:hypothetical protein
LNDVLRLSTQIRMAPSRPKKCIRVQQRRQWLYS